MTEDTAAITVPLDLFKRLVEMLDRYRYFDDHADEYLAAARREIEQVEALLASPLEGEPDQSGGL